MKQNYATGFSPSRTTTGHRTAMGRLLLMTMLLFTFVGGVNAQKALPYTYGFEDNDLTADGWVLQGATSNYTQISDDANRTDSYGFRFSYSEQSAFLLSPLLTGGESGVDVSFWYTEGSNSWGDEQFQVGYTTDETVTDASDFTFGDVVTASLEWQEYTNTFPAGTKRIAIKYIYNDTYYLYLDDFSFAVPSSCHKPSGVTVSDITNESAVVRWTSDASAWNVRYRISETENWTTVNGINTTSLSIDGLDAGTTYEVQVQTDCGGGETSDWTSSVSFSTEFCAAVDQCVINFALTDSYGDGWNGAAIKVVDVETGLVLGTFTNTSDAEKGEAQTYTLAVCNGREIQFVWVGGSYDGECSYVVTDVNDEVIVEGSGAGFTTFNYTVSCTITTCFKPTNVAAVTNTTTATVSWDGTNDSYQVQYRTAEATVSAEGAFSDDFENGLANWTVYQEGEAGGNWAILEPASWSSSSKTYAAHSGSYCVMARSWSGEAFNADNWLVSPQVTIPATMSYWVMGDSGYPETYDICVSTTGNAVADFTSVVTYNTNPDDWTLVTVDLSAYAGQTGYIAFHQYGNDKDYLWIDDVTIGETVTIPAGEWITVETNDLEVLITGLESNTTYEYQVRGYCTGEATPTGWTAMATFTTKVGYEDPIDLAATGISATKATLGWTGYQNNFNVQYRTAEVVDEYYFTNFNTADDRDGWTFSGSAIYGDDDPIYGYSGDENYFLQMGWNTTEEATIVSPELPNYESGTTLTFYYFGYSIANTFQVGYSSTTNDADAFTWSEPIDAPLGVYTLFSEELPDGIKYVAFKATASEQKACIFIDNFRVYKLISPAGEWISATATEPTLALSGLTPETKYDWKLQGVYEGGTTKWVNGGSFTTKELVEIELVNDDSESEDKKNSVFIADNVGKYCEVLLSDRTLFKDGNWNTICLPFDVDLTAADCPLDGATAKTLTNATVTKDESLTHIALTFGDAVTKLEAGVPYIIKWATDPDGKDVADPVFTDVLIKNVPAAYHTLSFADGKVQFTGYYDAFAIESDDIFYMTADSKLKNGGIGRIMKSCRAYFQFSDASAAREFVLDFGDNVTTGITMTDYTDSAGRADGWYTVDGVKFSAEPTRKGLYIQNGKKVVIK